MMFIVQLKTAALITAACVVVAGSGVIVAKEVLTQPVAPVSAQAEPKGLPPPTPATNDTATIAWGEAVNGLQAGLVPLGGVKGDAWAGERCRECTHARRITRKDASPAVARRVCAICGAPKPWSATFVEGEPMRLEIHLKNVGETPLKVAGKSGNVDWVPRLVSKADDSAWCARHHLPGSGGPGMPMVRELPKGEETVLDLVLARGWRFDKEPVPALNPFKEMPSAPLPAGKYTVMATSATAKVSTGMVEIEIVPATTGAVKHAFGQLPYDARKTLGDKGWLFIRSQARLDQVLEQFRAVEKPVRLPPVEFGKEMVFCHYALHDPDDKDEVVACTGDAQRLTLSLLQGIVGNRDMTPMPKMHVVFCVVPKTREFRLTTAQWVGASSPLLDEGTARKYVTFDRTFAPEQGDVVAGLRGSIRAEKNAIQPGDDIKIEFKLEWDDPNTGRKQAAAGASQPVYVWDGKYSAGYRNHAFLVETPDGKTELLRRPGQLAWDKNVPHPIEIKDGQPYVLPEWVEGSTWKSLKALGLDTTKPGVYKVTGIYMETAEETDGMAGRKPDGGKYPMWGGNLAANTVAIRVGATNAPAAKVTEADVRRIALTKATELYPKWQEHHDAKYGDPIRKATLADGIWTVEFSADNGRTGWSATIRIDAQTGKVLSAEEHGGA